jgi:hypothetical protein
MVRIGNTRGPIRRRLGGHIDVVPLAATAAPVLLVMARNASWWPALRLRALRIYVRWVGVKDDCVRTSR